MYKIKVSTREEDKIAITYLKEKLAKTLTVSTVERLTRTELTVDCNSPKLLRSIVLPAVVDLLITYYKLQYVKRELSQSITPEVACLLGTVVAFRQDEERRLIYDKIYKLDEINLDGILDFKLVDLSSEWTELGKLTTRLLSQCYENGDVYQLIAFMIGLEETKREEVTVDTDGRLYIGDRAIDAYPYLSTSAASTLYSILINRPSSIIIKSPQKMDDNVVQCVKNLGK